MSAWLCSPNHIGEICSRSGQVSGYNLVTKDRYDMDASTLAGLLAHQNLLSFTFGVENSFVKHTHEIPNKIPHPVN